MRRERCFFYFSLITNHFSLSRRPNGRLTAKQLSAIFALAKAKDWSNKDVRDFTHEMFGKMPDFLTKKEASAVIQHLQGGDND